MKRTEKHTKHARFTTRLLAVAVSLLLSIAATACASQNAPNNCTPHTGLAEKTRNAPPTISQLSTYRDHTISKTFENSPTTLELVKEVPLGENGVPYYLMYDGEPTYATIMPAEDFLVDKNGVFYSYDSMIGLNNLQNGEAIALDQAPLHVSRRPGTR